MVGLIVSSIALLLVAMTMLARANDLGARPGMVWHVRRIGFILAGFTPFAMIWVDWTSQGVHLTIYEVLFRVGICGVFVTTPYLPPWWKWLFGSAPLTPDDVRWSDDRRGMPRKGRFADKPKEPRS